MIAMILQDDAVKDDKTASVSNKVNNLLRHHYQCTASHNGNNSRPVFHPTGSTTVDLIAQAVVGSTTSHPNTTTAQVNETNCWCNSNNGSNLRVATVIYDSSANTITIQRGRDEVVVQALTDTVRVENRNESDARSYRFSGSNVIDNESQRSRSSTLCLCCRSNNGCCFRYYHCIRACAISCLFIL